MIFLYVVCLLLVGGLLLTITLQGLAAYRACRQDYVSLYDYLCANGATKTEAMRPFVVTAIRQGVRRALKRWERAGRIIVRAVRLLTKAAIQRIMPAKGLTALLLLTVWACKPATTSPDPTKGGEKSSSPTEKSGEVVPLLGKEGQGVVDEGPEEVKFLSPSSDGQGKVLPLQRYAYKAWWSETHRIPLAVSWYLTKEHTYGNSQRKNFAFTPDDDTRHPVTTYDYMQTGYDRGHMCPAGDNKWNRTAQEQTFLMTNICPQNHNLNKNDWNDLEQLCRTWARRYGRVYIVCGPVLRGSQHKTIGRERRYRITVPEAFYKVVMRSGKNPAAIGFVYDNHGRSQPMRQAVRSVDEIERLTGIDFFHSLPDDVENRIEAVGNLSAWSDRER